MKLPTNYQENRRLSEFSTFGIGGPARYFVEISHITDMQSALLFCYDHAIPYFILGKGSNCLFDDHGFNGLVIANRIDFLNKEDNGTFHVGAGYSFSLLGTQTARQGFSGLEFASGIPGSVGGAVYMNAGANGTETCDSLISVDYVLNDGSLTTFSKNELDFQYRYSSFHHKKGAIVAATFLLTDSLTAREKQLMIIDYRKRTQPYGSKSAGCVFRNPAKDIGAGALIDQSGLKGMSVGDAQVSSVHANFIVNTGSATAEDVIALIHLIQQEVKNKTGHSLESEVRCIPYSPTLTKE